MVTGGRHDKAVQGFGILCVSCGGRGEKRELENGHMKKTLLAMRRVILCRNLFQVSQIDGLQRRNETTPSINQFQCNNPHFHDLMTVVSSGKITYTLVGVRHGEKAFRGSAPVLSTTTCM